MSLNVGGSRFGLGRIAYSPHSSFRFIESTLVTAALLKLGGPPRTTECKLLIVFSLPGLSHFPKRMHVADLYLVSLLLVLLPEVTSVWRVKVVRLPLAPVLPELAAR